MPTIIEIEHLYKIYGDSPDQALALLKQGFTAQEVLERTNQVVGVDDVSLELQEGEILVIMGLSGSGKSTLVRCVNRLVRATSGAIRIEGRNVLTMNDAELRDLRTRQVSMVFQNFALLPHRTVLANVEFGLEVQKAPKAERRRASEEALDLVGLSQWGKRYPAELSGGMQQRVGLARALATHANILLMDEAFSALDPLIRMEMQNELLNLQAKIKKSILFISHDLDEALHIGDRVAIMNNGCIVQFGRPIEIMLHPASAYVADFVKNVNPLLVLNAGAVMSTDFETVPTSNAVLPGPGREVGPVPRLCVDRDGVFRGLLTPDGIVDATPISPGSDGITPTGSAVGFVREGTLIMDLIDPLTSSPYPMVVVEGSGRPVGHFNEALVLQALLSYRRQAERETRGTPTPAAENPR